MGDTLYGQRQYHEAIEEMKVAQKLSPEHRVIYAELARAYAQLKDREETLRYVELAEQPASGAATATDQSEESRILISTARL